MLDRVLFFLLFSHMPYYRSDGNRRHEMGCTVDAIIDDMDYYELVSSTESRLDWGGVSTNPLITLTTIGSLVCAVGSSNSGIRAHLCIIPVTETTSVAKIPPNYMEGPNQIGVSHDLSGVSTTQAPPLTDTMNTLCGCHINENTTDDGLSEPSQVCRKSGSNADTGTCYFSTGSNCTEGDFNCGTYYGYYADTDPAEVYDERSRINRLCQHCADGTVGQCTDTNNRCHGIGDNAACPSGSTPCTALHDVGTPASAIDRNLVGATLRETMAAIGSDGIGSTFGGNYLIDLLGQTKHNSTDRWIPSVIGGSDGPTTPDEINEITTLDSVNCMGVAPQMGSEHQHYSVLESTRYLSANTGIPSTPDAFPEGLTENALSAWCAASTTCSTPGDPRHYICVDSNYALHRIPTDVEGKCILRREQDAQYEEKSYAGGQKYADIGTSIKFAPACANWVDGFDPDEWCQSSVAFTGCIIVETDSHQSSLFEGNEIIKGYRIDCSGCGEKSQPHLNDTESCQTRCIQTTKCTVWSYSDDEGCIHYIDSEVWITRVVAGNISDRVGTVGGGSGSYLVPNEHAGPVINNYPAATGKTFRFNSIIFFVDAPYDDNTTIPSFNRTIRYRGIVEDGLPEAKSHTTAALDATFAALTLAEITTLTKSAFGSRPPIMYRLTLTTPLHVLGSPKQPLNDGGSYSAPRGYQIVIDDGDPPLIIFQYDVNVTESTPVSVRPQPIRTCVPLTVRRVVSASTIESDTSEMIVRRIDPVDCAIMGADPADIDKSLFGPGGCCDADQQLQWPNGDTTSSDSNYDDGTKTLTAQCNARHDVGIVSTMRTYSKW